MSENLVEVLVKTFPSIIDVTSKLLRYKKNPTVPEINVAILAGIYQMVKENNAKLDRTCDFINSLRSDLTRKGVI